jgi:hypothetical protein
VDGCRLWGFDWKTVSAGDAPAGTICGELPMMTGILSTRAVVAVCICARSMELQCRLEEKSR